MENVYARVAKVAAKQHGLITRPQALEAGLKPKTLCRLVKAGRWVVAHRSIYRVNGAPETWASRIQTVVLAAGPGAAISHRSAAALWDLDGFDHRRKTIHVTVPAGKRPRIAGTTVHRCQDLDAAEVTTRHGFPVTGLARTVLDLAATEPNPQVALRALDAVRRGPHHLPWSHLWRCLIRHTRRGRAGIRTYRTLLEKRDGTEPTDEEFEALVLDLLVDAGLPQPGPQHWVGRYRLYLAYVAWKVGIECQSKGWHLNEAAFEQDAVRENRLQLEGWLIIQVTWARLRDDPAGVVADVKEALECRRLLAVETA